MALLLSAAMMSGCAIGPNANDMPTWSLPLVVNYSTISCPEPDAAAKREFKRTTAAPVPDTTDDAGAPAVSKGALKKKADELRAGEVRKNAAGARVLRDYENCRAGSAASGAPIS